MWKKRKKKLIDGAYPSFMRLRAQLNFFCLLFSLIPTTRALSAMKKKKMNTFQIEICLSKFLLGFFSHLQNDTKARWARCYECKDIQRCSKSMRSHRLWHLCVPCVWYFPFSCESIKCVWMNDTFAVMRLIDISMCISPLNVLLSRLLLYLLSHSAEYATIYECAKALHFNGTNNPILRPTITISFCFFFHHLNSECLLEFIASIFHVRSSFEFKSSLVKSSQKLLHHKVARETNKFNTWGFYMLTYAIHVVDLLRLCV